MPTDSASAGSSEVNPNPASSPAAAREGPCSPAEVAAETAACNATATAALAEYGQLKQRSADLYQQFEKHNRAVTNYEGELTAFQSGIDAFQAEVTAFANAIAGLTAASTAILNWSDQLASGSAVLHARQDNLSATYDQLNSETQSLQNTEDAYDNDIDDFKKRLIDFLRSLHCIGCSAVRARLAQVEALPRKFQLNHPSAAPPAVPFVPPPPPLPPQPPPWPGPPPMKLGVGVSTVIPSGSALPAASIPPLIYAGEVFPNTIPIEGAPRVCVGQVWWRWYAGFTGPSWSTYEIRNEGHRGDRAQFLFQASPPPKVEVAGGLTASDIAVSSDRTKVYFTLYQSGSAATAGDVQITITNADGTVIKVHSDADYDAPSPYLTYTQDVQKGLSGLLASLSTIAIDSAFDEVRSQPDIIESAASRLANWIDQFDELLSRIQDRIGASPSASDLKAWSDEIPAGLPVVADERPFDHPWTGSIWPCSGTPAWYDVLVNRQGIPVYLGPNAVWNRAQLAYARMKEWADSFNLTRIGMDGQPFAGADELPDIDPGATVILSSGLGNVVIPSP